MSQPISQPTSQPTRMSQSTSQPANMPTTVFDRSHWGRIRLTGDDRVRFLHNQTTQNIQQLSVGEGGYTVFVTSTGRTIDLATTYAFPESLLVVVSPGMTQQLYDWMDRYIFFSDKVTLTDESEQTFLFTVLGEDADKVMETIGAGALIGQAPCSHQTVNTDMQLPITMAVGSDLALPGYTLWGPKAASETVWQALTAAGTGPGTPEQWETLRIQQGRPMPTHELTDDDNPLEAGLWDSISFEKGCYIGQETIARLNTYQGVKKRLWGFAPKLESEGTLTGFVAGATLYHEGNKVGKLTSITQTDAGPFALGYLRTKAGGEGLTVEIEGHKAEAIALPFVRHEYYSSE